MGSQPVGRLRGCGGLECLQGAPDVGVFQDQCEGLGPVAVHGIEDGIPPFHGIAKLPMEVVF